MEKYKECRHETLHLLESEKFRYFFTKVVFVCQECGKIIRLETSEFYKDYGNITNNKKESS